MNGSCIDDSCECPSTYEGTYCDTLSSDKYIFNLWHNSLLCQNGSSYLAAHVSAATSTVGGLYIYNVYQPGDSVFAIARRDTLTAPDQVYGVDYIRGNGFFSNDSFTLEFVVTSTIGVETNCVAVFSK